MGVPVPLTLRDLTHAQIWGIDTWGGDGIVIDGGLTDSVLESLSVTIQADGDTDETLQLDSDVNGNTPPPTYARADIDPFTQLGLRGIQIRKGPITGVTVDHVAMNGSWQVTDWDGATGAAIVDLAFSEAWIHHTASYAVQHTAIAPDSNPGSYGIGGRLADVTIWQNGGPSWRQDRWGNGSVTQAAVVEPYVTPVDQSGRSRVMVAPATSTDSDPSSSVVVGVPRLIAAGLSAVDVQRSPRQPALQWRFTAKDLFELTGWSRTV
jgi:hypothetical protein